MILSTLHHLALIRALGGDILASHEMQSERVYMQHGRTSCFAHSVNVACMSIWLAEHMRIKFDMRSLIRGALLHDFFLYDWHVADNSRRLHGFTHPKRALMNAKRLFLLNSIECNVIKRHMFPLTPVPPCCREAYIVCLADKLCALHETFKYNRFLRRVCTWK